MIEWNIGLFLNRIQEAHFLFDNDIIELLKEIGEKADEKTNIRELLESTDNNQPEYKTYVEKDTELFNWFMKLNIEKPFMKYLYFKDFQNDK